MELSKPKVSAALMEALSQQIGYAMPFKIGDTEEGKYLSVLMEALDPQDALEAMLVTQMLTNHHLIMRMSISAKEEAHGNTFANISFNKSTANLMNIFTRQLDTLSNYRSKKAPQPQRIVVERVTVEPGAQAIVGMVNTARGGGHDK